MDINQIIRDLAQKASEDYLLLKSDMNESIMAFKLSGNIDNDEILKRICEQANQNVYLGLFNDDRYDNSNIGFPVADSEKIKEKTKQSEQAMNDYKAPPKNFKLLLNQVSNTSPVAVVESEGVKLAEFNKVSEYRNTFNHFHGSLKTLRHSEIQSAEESFNKMAHEAKVMASNGESIGDIAKIAMRSVSEKGVDAQKIASAYNIIHEELQNSGFHVRSDFTKISSLKVNPNAEMLKPVHELALSLEKVAALNDMCANVSEVIDMLNNNIDERIKSA